MDIENKSFEQLLKQIEVRRVWEQSEPELSRSQLVEISKMFVNEALDTNDFRYLNTSLKLNDLLREQGELPPELATLEEEGLAELKSYVELQ